MRKRNAWGPLKPTPPPPPYDQFPDEPQEMRLRATGRGYYLPGWDVKVHESGVFDPDMVAKHFGCSRKKAEKAVEWAWDSARDQFWEQAQQDAEFWLDKHHPKVKVSSDGRSGGWLVLEGLPEIYDRNEDLHNVWDDETIKLVAGFEKDIYNSIDGYLNDKDALLDQIDANGWCAP